MRYFEEERAQIRISTKSVVIFGLITGLIVIALNAFYGLWP